MNVRNLLTGAATAGMLVIPALSFADVVQDAKTKLFDALDKDAVTVSFKSGSSELTQGEINDLKALVNANKGEAKIDRVIVAAWADKDYPAGKGEKLSDADCRLADARAAKVKTALKTLGIASVETYSMAEHPSWIAKTFNTKDAKVKGSGTVTDADDKLAKEIGEKLKSKGGPGNTVVLVRHEGDYSAH